MKPESVLYILPIFFLVFGFFWTLGFTVLVIRRRSFLKRSTETSGTVIAVDVRHRRPNNFGSTGTTHHYPTVRFQTADGLVAECRINVSLGERYEVGQAVVVNYDPANPSHRTQLGSRHSQPVWKYGIFIGAGVLIIVIGLVMSVVTFLLP